MNEQKNVTLSEVVNAVGVELTPEELEQVEGGSSHVSTGNLHTYGLQAPVGPIIGNRVGPIIDVWW